MSLWIALPLAVVVLGLLAVGTVFLRHWRQITGLDVDTIKEERTKRLKERIILERFGRFGTEKLGGIGKAFFAAGSFASKMGRRLVQRLYKLEQYYQRVKHPSTVSVDAVAVKRLLEQAADFVRQDETIQAEKLYIQVIGHHPKNVDAYEGLGNLYLKNKQYDQARETLRFALRLQAENASVLMSLGQLESQQDHRKEALESLRKAVTIRPKNPKYLDAYVEAALAAKSAEEAKKGIDLLREVNPENQKLSEFEARVETLTFTS